MAEVVSRPIAILTDNIPPPPPPVDLRQFCSEDLITSEDRFRIVKCLEYCQIAEVCKEECDEILEDCENRLSFCDQYIPCYTVWQVEKLNKQAAKYVKGNYP